MSASKLKVPLAHADDLPPARAVGTGDVVCSFRMDYNGNSLTITDFRPAGAEPEAGTWVLVLVGGFGLAVYRRLRTR